MEMQTFSNNKQTFIFYIKFHVDSEMILKSLPKTNQTNKQTEKQEKRTSKQTSKIIKKET
jgi:hypothetical protein